MCDRQCWKRGFKYLEITSVMVEDNRDLHTINFCESCYNLRQGERKEPIVNGREWRLVVAEKRARGKLATGLGAHGFERNIIRGQEDLCE